MIPFNLKIYGNSKFQDETFGTIFRDENNEYIWLADRRFYNNSNGAIGGHQILTFGLSAGTNFCLSALSFGVRTDSEMYPKRNYIVPIVTIKENIKIIGGTGIDSSNAYELKK